MKIMTFCLASILTLLLTVRSQAGETNQFSSKDAKFIKIALIGGQLPEVPDQTQTSMALHLQKMDGHDFDKAYIDDMVKDHDKDIALFISEAEHGEDADLKEWASKTLPTLQMHLQMAKEAQAKVTPSNY